MMGCPTFHVMHVPGFDPERDRIVRQLAEEHPHGQVCIHADPDRRGILWNYWQALQCADATDDGSDWVAIVADDAQPFPGWVEELPKALRYSPTPFLPG